MSRERGFSLIELMVAMAMMLLIMGGVLQLLNQSQQRSVSTANVEDATSMARESLDQMVREIRLAGYPPQNSYPSAFSGTNEQYAARAGGALLAATNLAYSIHFEADINNAGTIGGDSTVTVVDYRLELPSTGGWPAGSCPGSVATAVTVPTLMRSAVPKNSNGTFTQSWEPFLPNVWNCNSTTQTPIFTYCNVATPTGGCPDLATLLASTFPRVVLIRLQSRGANQDPQTRQFQLVEFFGSAHRINPDQ